MTKLISEMTVRVDDDVLLQVSLEPAPEGQTVERWKACMTDRVEGLTVAQGRMVSGFLQILVQALPDPQVESLKGYTGAFKRSEDKARAKLIAEMREENDALVLSLVAERKCVAELEAMLARVHETMHARSREIEDLRDRMADPEGMAHARRACDP